MAERIEMVCWRDLIDHAVDYLGASPSGEARRDARRASLEALRDLASAGEWHYYYDRWRLNLVGAYLSGTVDYDHTGGASERLLTLTGGVWPAWAAFGTVVMDNIPYEVASRLSDTALTLTENANPGADLIGEPYHIYRDTYPLPCYFQSVGSVILVNHMITLLPEHPNAWLERQRVFRGTSMPRTYTVRGDPQYMNTLSLSFFPAPDIAYQVDMVYRRRPRPMLVDEYSTGTVSTTPGSAVVAGSGTAWTSRLGGTVFRIGMDPTKPVTGKPGPNGPALERQVVSVDSPTQLTLDDVAEDNLSRAQYLMSDPADVETGAMYSALLRGIEAQMAKSRRMQDRAQAEGEYVKALIRAREADSRSFAEEQGGTTRRPWPVRLRDMPISGDVS